MLTNLQWLRLQEAWQAISYELMAQFQQRRGWRYDVAVGECGDGTPLPQWRRSQACRVVRDLGLRHV